MKNIVKVENEELLVTVADIAKFSGNKEKSVRDLLTRNSESFKEIGLSVVKEYDLKSQSKIKLNEEQTSFLLILMRNNPTIVKFKLELVKQFYEIKNKIAKENKSALGTIMRGHELQLEEKDKQITEAKRKAYAHTRKGNYQCVTNIIRDTSASISANVFNKILLEKKYLNQKEVTVKKYEANNKESITSLDGNILIHYDTAIEVLKDFEIDFEEDEQMMMEF